MQVACTRIYLTFIILCSTNEALTEEAKMPILLESKPFPSYNGYYTLDFFKQISRFNEFDFTTSVTFSCFVLFVSKLNDKRNNFCSKMND